MTKKSAMTFLGLALNWKWHHPPPPFGNSTEIHLIWCGYPSLMCIYKISFIRVYLSIYCLQPAGCIFIKSYFFATTSTNQPPSPPDRPTNHRPSVLSPSPTINPVFLYLPYPTINHDNQDDQPSIKSFLHLQYPANNLMIKVIFSYLSQELPAIICETLSETFTMLWSYLWNILF